MATTKTKLLSAARKQAVSMLKSALNSVNNSLWTAIAVEHCLFTSAPDLLSVYKQMVRESLCAIAMYRARNPEVQEYTHTDIQMFASAAVRAPPILDEEQEHKNKLMAVQERMKSKGKRCRKCGGRVFTYEKQERSMDEGATVYHQCMNDQCNHLERQA